MSEYEKSAFEQKLAIHTAPTLCGMKCANLFSVCHEETPVSDCLKDFSRLAGKRHLKIKRLCKCHGRTLLYVYHETLLRNWLEKEAVKTFLQQYDYSLESTLEEKLHILGKRISCDNFPHEIGVFLGYPLEDIQGFIQNEGKNCLLCGYWKVYCNPEQAQQTFQTYGRCRKFLCDKLNQGLNLNQALEISKEEFLL